MIVLEPITTTQSFYATLREFSTLPNKMLITDKETNISDEVDITVANGDYTQLISFDYDKLIEGHLYRLEVYYNTIEDLRWRGLMFITSQSVDSYTINNNTYEEKTTTNDFIIYE